MEKDSPHRQDRSIAVGAVAPPSRVTSKEGSSRGSGHPAPTDRGECAEDAEQATAVVDCGPVMLA